MSEMTTREWEAILEKGEGYVFNDFSGKNPSGRQDNILHRADCRTLTLANLAVSKEFFRTVEEAVEWLDMFRTHKWKPCDVCCKDLAGPAPERNPR